MKRILIALLFALPAFGQNVPYSDITLSSRGTPVGGAPIAVCSNPGLTTTAAQVISNIAVLTMSSNPITAGFVANQAIAVSGFTGADTYFNGGTVTSTGITNNFLILSVTSTQITYSLVHANASATTNGSVFQAGGQAQACAPLSSIFNDVAGTSPITQPGLTSTGLGNYQFYAAAAPYYVQFYGATIGEVIKPVTLPVSTANSNTFTGTTILCNQGSILYVGDGCIGVWTGLDIGAQVNFAYAACGTQGCTIRLLQRPGGTACYSYSTPIIFGTSGKFFRFEADVSSSSGSNQGACLNYTPTTATSAITINADNGNQKTGWGVYGLQILNNGGCVTQGGCASSATAITVTHGSFVEIANTQINGFGNAITFGFTGPFGMKVRDMNFSNNTTAVNVTAAYENLFFERGLYQLNGTAFNFANAGAGGLTEIKIKDISCDDNSTVCINIANQTGLNSFIFDNIHHENVTLVAPNYLTAGTGTNVTYIGGGLYDDTTTNQAQMVSSSGSTLLVYGTHLKKNSGSMTQVFNLTSPVRARIEPVNDTSNTLTTLIGGTSTTIDGFAMNGFNAGGPSIWHAAEAPLFYEGAVSWGSIPNDPIAFTQGVKLCMANGNYCMGNGNNTFQTEVGTWFQVGPALFANNASATTPDSVGGIALSASPGGFAAKEGTAPTGAGATWDHCYGDSTAHALKCSYNGGTFLAQTQTVASGTASMTTAAITSGTCGSTVTVSATGVLTTDSIIANPNNVTGTPNALLTLVFWPTANNVVFEFCNPTAGSLTPAAETINWRVTR